MSGNNWFILIAGLVLSSVLAMAGARKMSAPLPKYKSPLLEEQNAGVSLETPSADKAGKATSKKAAKSNREYDVLWEKSLFNDARKEGENGPETATAEVQGRAMANSEFEVVGIARIGKKDEAVPVAIITQVKSNVRQNNRNNFRGNNNYNNNNNFRGNNNNMNNNPGRRPMNRQAEPEPVVATGDRRVDKNIYRAGDAIADTGYTVKSIIVEENKVIITRAGADLTLVLDEANTNNSVRRENAKKEALAVQSQYREKEKADAQRVKDQAEQAKRKARFEEQARNFARSRGQTLSNEELQRRVQFMENMHQQRQRMQQLQQQQQQQQQRQQQQNQQNVQRVQMGGAGSMPPGPPGSGGFGGRFNGNR